MGTLRARHWLKMFDLHPERRPNTYVETGLWFGKQLRIAVNFFDHVVGIELDAYWYEHCVTLAADWENVELLHGDTRELLPVVSERFSDEPIAVKLDAHWCATTPPIPITELPVWDELGVLAARDQPDIVAVDDVHVFGRPGQSQNIAGYAGWEDVTIGNLRDVYPCSDAVTLGGAYVMWR